MIALNLIGWACILFWIAVAASVGVFGITYLTGWRLFHAGRKVAAIIALALGLLIFVTLLFTGYLLFSYPGAPLVKPSPDAITGTWLPSSRQNQELAEADQGLFSRSLTLHPDGTFVSTPLDNAQVPCAAPVSYPCLAEGSWTVQRGVDDDWWLYLYMQKADGKTVSDVYSYRIGNPFPPYQLYDYRGDPDDPDSLISMERQ